ncbi:MAG: hypothetical protein R2695_04760 [Acidimicrobiales bacterium]
MITSAASASTVAAHERDPEQVGDLGHTGPLARFHGAQAHRCGRPGPNAPAKAFVEELLHGVEVPCVRRPAQASDESAA